MRAHTASQICWRRLHRPGGVQPQLSPASLKSQRTCMSSLLCGLSIGEETARARARERERGLSVPAPSVATSWRRGLVMLPAVEVAGAGRLVFPLSWRWLSVDGASQCCASCSLRVGICGVTTLVFLARRRHAVLPDDDAAQWPRAAVPHDGGRPTYHFDRRKRPPGVRMTATPTQKRPLAARGGFTPLPDSGYVSS